MSSSSASKLVAMAAILAGMGSIARMRRWVAWGLLASSGALLAQPNEEVPFVVTPDHVTLAMLRLAGVGPRDHVIDLGSGDGRIVITAAKRFGATGVGIEIVPELVERSRANASRARVADRAAFVEQDLFKADLSRASVITMYLLPAVNLQLRPALLALEPGTRLVSHDWDLGDWRPDRTLTVDVPAKAVGREKLSRLHLWRVPAQVDGLWCGEGEAWIRIRQRFQFVDAEVGRGPALWAAVGRLDGLTLELQGERGAALRARAGPEQLAIAVGRGPWRGLPRVYRRSRTDPCAGQGGGP
jgi:SAM-dependent methyltransferase